jgi:hypothetical protein
VIGKRVAPVIEEGRCFRSGCACLSAVAWLRCGSGGQGYATPRGVLQAAAECSPATVGGSSSYERRFPQSFPGMPWSNP